MQGTDLTITKGDKVYATGYIDNNNLLCINNTVPVAELKDKKSKLQIMYLWNNERMEEHQINSAKIAYYLKHEKVMCLKRQSR